MGGPPGLTYRHNLGPLRPRGRTTSSDRTQLHRLGDAVVHPGAASSDVGSRQAFSSRTWRAQPPAGRGVARSRCRAGAREVTHDRAYRGGTRLAGARAGPWRWRFTFWGAAPAKPSSYSSRSRSCPAITGRDRRGGHEQRSRRSSSREIPDEAVRGKDPPVPRPGWSWQREIPSGTPRRSPPPLRNGGGRA